MRKASPRSVGVAIASVRASVEPKTPLAAVQWAWVEAVGDRIAAEAQPVSERDGVVTVACRASTWAQELDLLHDDLLAGLRSAVGETPVERLRFIVSPEPFQDTL
ncbi:MAG: DciA family protein [Solirubrobacterales bacterium]